MTRRRSQPGSEGPGTWPIVSGVVLGAIVVLGAVIFFTSSSPRPRRSALAAPPAPSPNAPRTTAASPSGACNVAGDGSTTGLSSVPSDLNWVVLGGDVVPASASAGPMLREGTVGRCFADDAAGALIASVRIQDQIAGATAASWPDASAGLVPGPLVDELDTQMATVLAQPAPPSDTDSPFSRLAGFKFLSYSPSAAVIDLVYATSSGGLYSSSETMQWVGGDWRIEMLGADELSSPQTTVGDLVGYVAWTQP